jgi:UDP-glucuronate 4-epimerase
MAYYKFVKAIAEDRPIDVYNYGKMMRDFTYIDDVVAGIVKLIPQRTKLLPPYKIYNLGNNNPVELQEFIAIIETLMGKLAQKNFLPMQPGDVVATYADIEESMTDIGFKPATSITHGLATFVNWYRAYYGYTTARDKLLSATELSTVV